MTYVFTYEDRRGSVREAEVEAPSFEDAQLLFWRAHGRVAAAVRSVEARPEGASRGRG